MKFLALVFFLFSVATTAEETSCWKKILGFTEKKAELVKPWSFSAAEEASFSAVFEDSSGSDFDKLSALVWKVMDARTDQRNPVSKFFVRRAKKTILTPGFYDLTLGFMLGKYVGPHYNPIFNSVSFGPYAKNPVVRNIAGGHELVHAMQRNTSLWFPLMMAAYNFDISALVFRTPIPPLVRFRLETEAIGSQWEIVSRIPPNLRDTLMQHLALDADASQGERLLTANFLGEHRDDRIAAGEKVNRAELRFIRKAIRGAKNPKSVQNKGIPVATEVESQVSPTKDDQFSFMLRKIAYASLFNAGLSKEDFIGKMKEMHGYTLQNLAKQHLLKADFFRLLCIYTTLSLMRSLPMEFWHQIAPKDVKLILHLLNLY